MPDPGAIAHILKEYGGWGTTAFLILVVVKLYRDKDALSTGYLERLISGLAETASAARATKDAITELNTMIAATGRAVSEHDHRIAILVEKVVHGFGNTSAGMEGVANELRRIRDRDDRGRS